MHWVFPKTWQPSKRAATRCIAARRKRSLADPETIKISGKNKASDTNDNEKASTRSTVFHRQARTVTLCRSASHSTIFNEFFYFFETNSYLLLTVQYPRPGPTRAGLSRAIPMPPTGRRQAVSTSNAGTSCLWRAVTMQLRYQAGLTPPSMKSGQYIRARAHERLPEVVH